MKNGRLIYIAVIGFVFMYLMYAMAQYSGQSGERQADSIRRIIDKALVQCYALEGGYPADIDRVSQYGVVLDRSKYIFHYEWFGSNLRPKVLVMEK
jgi:hypothetical protein